MKKRLLTTLLILTLMLTSLGGAALAEDKVLIVGQAEDTTTLDPQMQGDMPAMSILINIYDTLITRDEGGNLIPCLATEWEALDETTWQFKLREGVTFHNGEPFNAESVKATLERLIDPATGSPIEEQENLTGIEVVDEYTINLTFSGSDPLVPAKLVMFGGVMLPAEYTNAHDAEYLAQNPVGTGPYKFVSWTKDYEVVLEKNEDYWLGAPAYDKLIESKFADIRNSVGRPAGSITAAQFLQRFVNDTPWAHLDIAGTAFGAGKSDVNTSWAPGFGVALLDRLVRDHYQG